jgi:peptidoglycan/xylan/chitin deacetylase (PgdA/CDA1 family)
VFQTYWAIATMRDNRWGTRDSTVKQERIDPRTVVDLRGGTVPGLEIHQRLPRLPWNVVPHEKRRRQAVAGLAMLALSVVPFHVYFTRTQEGGLLWAKASTSFAPVRTASLAPDDRAYAVAHAPTYRGAVALLVYHGLGRGSDAEGSGRFTIAPSRFAEQLSMLKAAGMRAVTARDVALAVTGRHRLPPNAFMISFDDGRTDAMLYADPILRRLGMRATMFVITGQASERGLYYVPWTKLRGYARSGRWDLESHSAHAHHEVRVAGRTLPALTAVGRGEGIGRYTRRVRADLAEASRTIARETGVRPLAFAYPFGAYAGPYDARTNDPRVGGILERTVRERYVVSFNQDDQSTWALSSCADDPHRLRRLEVGDWTGRALLSRIASAAAGFGEPECAKTTPAAVPEPAAAPSTKAPEAPAGFAPAPPARAPAVRIQVPAVPSVVASAADAPTIVRPDPTDAPRATPAPTPRVTPAPTPRVTPAPTPRVTARPTASPPRGHGPPPGVPRGGPRA